MELPNTEAMSIEEKIWFARAIAGMIVADGRVDDSELEFLKEAISFLEDRDQVNGIMAVVRQGKTPSLEARKIDPKQSFIILKYLAELMVVDGKCQRQKLPSSSMRAVCWASPAISSRSYGRQHGQCWKQPSHWQKSLLVRMPPW